jgi:hypothetical protein
VKELPARNGRVLNCIPSSSTEDDWLLEAAASAGIIKTRQRIPESKDLRDNTWWKIRDQGKTGSCVGWAVADSLLRWHFVRTRKLKKQHQLSVRYVWMSAKETDDVINKPTTFIEEAGTRIKTALNVARLYGVVTESVLPFHSRTLYARDETSFYLTAGKLKIVAYFHLKGPASWRRWIAQNGPVVVGMLPDRQFHLATKKDSKLYKYDQASADSSGHAVALVGYTPTHFILRNSWGKSWGDGGYAYVYDAYARAAIFEAYGIHL